MKIEKIRVPVVHFVCLFISHKTENVKVRIFIFSFPTKMPTKKFLFTSTGTFCASFLWSMVVLFLPRFTLDAMSLLVFYCSGFDFKPIEICLRFTQNEFGVLRFHVTNPNHFIQKEILICKTYVFSR